LALSFSKSGALHLGFRLGADSSGGSVKPENAALLFAQPGVDAG
jgi:hypothetical protein